MFPALVRYAHGSAPATASSSEPPARGDWLGL